MTTPPPETYDLIVVGLGPGGEEVAERMAEAGWSVLGIDRHLVGGECPYYGCIPSKMVIRGAAVLAEGGRVNVLSSGRADIAPDYRPVGKRIRDEATDNWDDKVAVERFERLGGTFVRGAGQLAGRADDGSVQIEVGGSTYRAPNVVISVGTSPAIPPIPGLADLRGEGGPESPIWTNRDVLRAQDKLGDAFASYRGAISILVALVGRDDSNADWRKGLNYSVEKIGGLAYQFVISRNFGEALGAADQAISLAPEEIWLYSNRAHALMFLGRTGEARALYLKYRDKKDVQDGKSWPVVILEDFGDLRKNGLANPLMGEIEKAFAASG